MSAPEYAFPWEREAMQGAEMPDGLSLHDQMAYITLRTLYHDYHEKRMDRQTASAEKRRIFGAWDRAKRTAEFERKLAFFHARLYKDTEGPKQRSGKTPPRRMQSRCATCWMGWSNTGPRPRKAHRKHYYQTSRCRVVISHPAPHQRRKTMPNCKICGHQVVAGPVMHSDCLTKLVTETAEKFCDSYCVWSDMYTSQEQLERERCEGCPMDQLMKLAK